VRQNNVFIRARRRGKLVYRWEGHNVWTDVGRQHVANLLTLSSYGPDTPLTSARIRHMQFGIGGVQQGVIPAGVVAAYPAGFDPHATTGNEYSHDYPVAPAIGTLERPVRLSGGTNPYNTAPGTDVWLTDPAMPQFFVDYPTDFSVSLKYFIRGMDGDIAYTTLTEVPLAEAGLVLSSGDINDAYNPVVAYVDFEPLTITDEVEAEVTWIVGL
jgi:hypothetical protein